LLNAVKKVLLTGFGNTMKLWLCHSLVRSVFYGAFT